MQSHESSKQQGHVALPLPWGFGSMAFHGATWQLIWRDTANQVRYKGSGTGDAREAQRLLAQLALPRAKGMVEALERIANGEETYQGHAKARPGAGRPRANRRAQGTDRNRPKGTKGETH